MNALPSDDVSVYCSLRLRVFAGYSGWGGGQLEAELAEEAWIVEPASPDDVFSSEPAGLWSAVLRRKGGPFAILARLPIDPSPQPAACGPFAGRRIDFVTCATSRCHVRLTNEGCNDPSPSHVPPQNCNRMRARYQPHRCLGLVQNIKSATVSAANECIVTP